MGTQGKLGKDAGSVACYAREQPRTPIQRRHACSWPVRLGDGELNRAQNRA